MDLYSFHTNPESLYNYDDRLSSPIYKKIDAMHAVEKAADSPAVKVEQWWRDVYSPADPQAKAQLGEPALDAALGPAILEWSHEADNEMQEAFVEIYTDLVKTMESDAVFNYVSPEEALVPWVKSLGPIDELPGGFAHGDQIFEKIAAFLGDAAVEWLEDDEDNWEVFADKVDPVVYRIKSAQDAVFRKTQGQ
jgi:hypothetical protein